MLRCESGPMPLTISIRAVSYRRRSAQSLAHAFEIAGYSKVRSGWSECRCDAMMIENMLMFYDEVRDTLASMKILSRGS